jgi:8-oxo-dGTP pyrophosphatase MutT (NUDIX family)
MKSFCPNCNSTNLLVYEKTAYVLNTLEHWCDSVKAGDSDAECYCRDCEWDGNRQSVDEYSLGNMKTAVCLLVKTGSNTYLSVSRPKSKQWGLVGGKVDEGETLIQAIVREAKEEANLELDQSKLKLAFADISVGDVDYYTTTFTYPQLSTVELDSLLPEQGLVIGALTREQLCSYDVSPFADYNRTLFARLPK